MRCAEVKHQPQNSLKPIELSRHFQNEMIKDTLVILLFANVI